MKPQTIGRVLGVGVRVAGRMAGRAIAGPDRPSAPHPPSASAANAATVAGTSYSGASCPGTSIGPAGQAARATVQAGRGVRQGVGGFLRPFRRVGAIVWLEVTGVFFLLPVIVFTPLLWQTRADWAHGPEHRKFVSAAVVVAVFFYLGVTAFLRARKRSKA